MCGLYMCSALCEDVYVQQWMCVYVRVCEVVCVCEGM